MTVDDDAIDPTGPGGDGASRRSRPLVLAGVAVVVVLAVLGAVLIVRSSSDDSTTTDAGAGPGDGSTTSTTVAPIGPELETNWNGVRTDGSGLVIAFYGLAPTTSADDLCQSDYQAVVDETDDEVRVTLHGSHVDTCAEDIAYGRSATVPLARPLGDRRLVNGATERRETAFDGSRIPTASWLPDGWEQLVDLPADPHTPLVTAWQVGWGPDRSSGTACGADVSPVTLTVGSPDLLDQTWVTSFVVVGTTTVHGQPAEQARYQTGPPEHPSDETMLRWSEGGDALVLRSSPSCPGEPPADFALLQQLADGLS